MEVEIKSRDWSGKEFLKKGATTKILNDILGVSFIQGEIVEVNFKIRGVADCEEAVDLIRALNYNFLPVTNS